MFIRRPFLYYIYLNIFMFRDQGELIRKECHIAVVSAMMQHPDDEVLQIWGCRALFQFSQHNSSKVSLFVVSRLFNLTFEINVRLKRVVVGSGWTLPKMLAPGGHLKFSVRSPAPIIVLTY